MKPIRLNNPKARAAACAKVMAAPDGWIVTVKEETRRDAQNRLFWEVMGDLAQAQPEGRCWTKETWRDAAMHTRGHEVEFAEGPEDSGPFPIGFRSSHLTVRQMTDLLEWAFSYGSRHGVVFTIDRRRAAEVFGGLAA